MPIDQRIERLGLWSVFHKHMILELFTSLRDELGDEYWVDIETEVLLVPRPSGPARPVTPDADVVRTSTSSLPEQGQRDHSHASSLNEGVGAVTPALLEVDESISEFEQSWIEIRRRDWPDSDDPFHARVVSVVELLSPSNKGVFGKRDLKKFLSKRRDYLLSTVSYSEIDMLEGGTRDLPAALTEVAQHPLIAWSAQAREQTRHYWAWGWNSEQPLPTMVLPLDHPQVHSVDLAQCYERAYTNNHWPSRMGMN